MTEALSRLDLSIFYFINQSLVNPVFDWLCPLFRNKLTWVPLYVLLGIVLYRKYDTKLFTILIFTVLTIVITDQLSSSIIKPYFHRMRPCNNPEVEARLLLDYCGAGFSFVSSHAANHFGLAVFLAFLFENRKRAFLLLGLWAAIVSFSQVYVGVHYPADVLMGGLLGVLAGSITALTGKRYFKTNL